MNAQVPPEIMALLEQFTQGGIAEDENDLLAAQYKTADEMRRTKMPEMRSYGANHVVAPNPMEVAAAAIQQYRGGQAQRDTMDQMKANQGTTGAGARALMLAKLLRNYQTTPKGPPPPPAAQPYNGAMMAPDPSTMTSESVDPFADAPWENLPPRPAPGRPRPKPVAPPVVMPPGSGD